MKSPRRVEAQRGDAATAGNSEVQTPDASFFSIQVSVDPVRLFGEPAVRFAEPVHEGAARIVAALPADVSARSLRAAGAMALLCADVDSDRIRLLGRWQSDQMFRYLHVQAGHAAFLFPNAPRRHLHLAPQSQRSAAVITLLPRFAPSWLFLGAYHRRSHDGYCFPSRVELHDSRKGPGA